MQGNTIYKKRSIEFPGKPGKKRFIQVRGRLPNGTSLNQAIGMQSRALIGLPECARLKQPGLYGPFRKGDKEQFHVCV